jgi:hypothetical protein
MDLPARSCEGCTACCHILPIVEQDVQKPANAMCGNCIPGVGCGIYETRYHVCRRFMCTWVTDMAIPQHWQPSQSHMVILNDEASGTLVVHVDAAFPDVWRAAPYIDDLHAWAGNPTAQQKRIVVLVDRDHTVIFPVGEKFIGEMKPGQALRVHKITTMFWTAYDADVVDGTDPRAAGAIGALPTANQEALRLDLVTKS